MDPVPDPGDPKTYGSYGSGSTTLVYKVCTVQVGTRGPTAKKEQNPGNQDGNSDLEAKKQED
jgi:hypothetical protein